ncbi:MAG: hypothetical protein N3H31_04890, partial [Candidatus Nezhaarchaeota archaeon]|nr:hypothetical protein [Candidatus Nezhaarchaeota archaeon]
MKIHVTLVTGRTLDQGRFLEEGKFLEPYASKCAIVELDPQDLAKLGVEAGSNVKVKTGFGEVVVKAVPSAAPQPGVAFIPMGPWASAVVDPRTYGSGMPNLKGIRAEIEPTQEPVKTITELFKGLSHKPFEVKVGSSGGADPSEEVVINDVVCVFCGCTCDNLQVTVKG